MSYDPVGTPAPQGAVPEPATWAMMLLGFGGIGMALRRSRRVQARQLRNFALELFPSFHGIEVQAGIEHGGRQHEARIAICQQHVSKTRGQADASFCVYRV